MLKIESDQLSSFFEQRAVVLKPRFPAVIAVIAQPVKAGKTNHKSFKVNDIEFEVGDVVLADTHGKRKVVSKKEFEEDYE